MNRIKWICILFLCILVSTNILAESINWDSAEFNLQRQAIRTQRSIIASTELVLQGFIKAYRSFDDSWMTTIGALSIVNQQIEQNNTLLEGQMTLRQSLLKSAESSRVYANDAMEQYKIASKELAGMEASVPGYDAILERYIYWSNVFSYHQNAINELNANANQVLAAINTRISEIANLIGQSVILLTAANEYLLYMDDLYKKHIKPRQTTIKNANAEITRIVTGVITSHIESHGENEEPHEHSGP